MIHNLGIIWEHLDTEDKKVICTAINHFGSSRINSYLYQHRLIKHDDPKLIFLKIKPIYYALKSTLGLWNVKDKERNGKIIRLIDLVIK